jgi:hypothetical protein
VVREQAEVLATAMAAEGDGVDRVFVGLCEQPSLLTRDFPRKAQRGGDRVERIPQVPKFENRVQQISQVLMEDVTMAIKTFLLCVLGVSTRLDQSRVSGDMETELAMLEEESVLHVRDRWEIVDAYLEAGRGLCRLSCGSRSCE